MFISDLSSLGSTFTHASTPQHLIFVLYRLFPTHHPPYMQNGNTFFHAKWVYLASQLPSLSVVFSVCRAVCWHAIGEEMLEQIRIVFLGYIWVTPVELLVSPVSSYPDKPDRNEWCVLDPIDEGDLPRRKTVIFTKVHRCGPTFS